MSQTKFPAPSYQIFPVDCELYHPLMTHAGSPKFSLASSQSLPSCTLLHPSRRVCQNGSEIALDPPQHFILTITPLVVALMFFCLIWNFHLQNWSACLPLHLPPRHLPRCCLGRVFQSYSSAQHSHGLSCSQKRKIQVPSQANFASSQLPVMT